MTTDEDKELTVAEVAARLRVSEFAVRDWLRKGYLRGFRMGGTKAGWRIRPSEVQRYITEREEQTYRKDQP